MTSCILEANVTTAQIAYPFQREWISSPDWLVLRDRVSDEFLADGTDCALVDALTATKYLDTYSVVADVALVSNHRSAIAMQTDSRPDEIEHATVQLGNVSRTAEGLARATVHHFYGIDVVDWYRSQQDAEVRIVEDAEALQRPEAKNVEDLARAWFILTSMAIPTHVFIAPTAVLEANQPSVRKMVETLRSAIDISLERRRELRRNLSADLDIDREALTELHNDQKTRLTRNARKGWIDLTNRVSRALDLPSGANPDVVSFGLAQED
jgi:predicted solute-binding protein